MVKRYYDKVFLIAELHPQHEGDMSIIEQMIVQCKMAGIDAVKLQLYSSQLLFGDNRKEFAEISLSEFKAIKKFADNMNIDVFASLFDISRIKWCEDLGIKYYKLASRVVNDRYLCESIIQTGKPVFASVNLKPLEPFPYVENNVQYFYCVSNYPALLEDVHMPSFKKSAYIGFSDHTIGLTAAKVAVVKGAKYIEKHFTISKAIQSSHTMGNVGGMVMSEAMDLRKFCEDFARIGHDQ